MNQPEPDGSLPHKGGDTDSSNCITFEFDEPGDTTPRPRRPNIPRPWTPPTDGAAPDADQPPKSPPAA